MLSRSHPDSRHLGQIRGRYLTLTPDSYRQFRLEVKAYKTEISWKPEVIDVVPPPISKDLKRRWSYFIRKVYETDPLTYPKCQGEMRIISFIDQPDVIKKILHHFGLWEESHAPPDRNRKEEEITFDPSFSQYHHHFI